VNSNLSERVFKQIRVLLVAFAALMPFSLGFAADVAAGKAKVTQQCAECHRPADWDGETTAALESLLRDVVSGKVPHRKRPIQLTDQEIADVAAYWTSGRKK
jgi:mono/diheme cytochrome c family protein